RLAVVPALMAAADATQRLQVASWVFCNDFRHPVVMYKEAATIDLLSDGRLEVGIGAGWLKSEYDMAGIPFDPPGVRVSRMEEAVRIFKGLAADGPFKFKGDHYHIDGFEGAPKPFQKPYPPLSIGGGGKRVLSFAAREADIVSITAKALPEGGLDGADITFEATRRKVDWVRQAAGDRDPELNVLIYTFEVTDDREAAAKRHAEHLQGLTPDELLASPHVLIGTTEQMAEDLQQRRRDLGISYIVLNTNVVEDTERFAPVVAALSGR
ncbi:MAG TPA: TIGR03621 family F420-dependent LLM class oxidoreductase, partial [Thermomicrobiales bacterium]|nr:TIGR03621 family F420-dependent LLM class oxidoreductase [Thermomicrobiales bacterium]